MAEERQDPSEHEPSFESKDDIEWQLPASHAIKQTILTAATHRLPSVEPGIWQSTSLESPDGRQVRISRENSQDGGLVISFISKGFVGETDEPPTYMNPVSTNYWLDNIDKEEISLRRGTDFVVSEAEAKQLLEQLALVREVPNDRQ